MSVATEPSLMFAPLQRLLEPVHLGGALTDQRRPIAGQLPQLALLAVGHEAGAQQPVTQQVGEPLAVLDVGLAPWHRLDVLRVDQQQLDLAFQQVPDRLPIHPGALHRQMGALDLGQPVPEPQDLVGRRSEGLDLLLRVTTLARRDPTRHQHVFVDVQPATARIHDLHHTLRPPDMNGPRGVSSHQDSAVRASLAGAPFGGASGHPGQTLVTGSRHQTNADLVNHDPSCTHDTTRPDFSSHGGAPPGMTTLVKIGAWACR